MYHSYERLKVNIQILLKYGTSSLGTLEIKEFLNKIDNIDENDTNNLCKYNLKEKNILLFKERFRIENKVEEVNINKQPEYTAVTFIYLNAIKEVMYNKLIDKPIENRVESFSIILNYLYDQLIRIKGISINQLDYIRSIIPEQLLAFKCELYHIFFYLNIRSPKLLNKTIK
ncbi:hypothetical protein ACTFIZ_012219 [Dictyostelium cf. discoideum]